LDSSRLGLVSWPARRGTPPPVDRLAHLTSLARI